MSFDEFRQALTWILGSYWQFRLRLSDGWEVESVLQNSFGSYILHVTPPDGETVTYRDVRQDEVEKAVWMVRNSGPHNTQSTLRYIDGLVASELVATGPRPMIADSLKGNWGTVEPTEAP